MGTSGPCSKLFQQKRVTLICQAGDSGEMRILKRLDRYQDEEWKAFSGQFEMHQVWTTLHNST